MQHTQQEDFWTGDFGREYTDRNSRPLDEWNEFYRGIYGHTKLEMNAEFLGELPREARILEVGCNTGMQLVGLQAAWASATCMVSSCKPTPWRKPASSCAA